MSARVLLIDDSETERAYATERLERAGHTVWGAVNGNEGLRRLFEVRPDVVLLDLVMPERDGWETLELIRQVSDVPVIMVTGNDTELERVRGLKAGADDYIGKPYGAPELVARIEALLRRTNGKASIKDVWDDGVVKIDYGASRVTVHGDEVSLTPLEFKLLGTLVDHAGQVLSRHQLLDLVWGDAGARGGDEVKLYVGYLRRKIGAELIETVRGFGYRYAKR